MIEVKLDLDGPEAVWLERLAKDLAERDGFTWTRERVLMAGRGGLRSRLTFERSATDIMQLPSVRAILALAREAEGQGWRDIESYDGGFDRFVLVADAAGFVSEARLLDDGRGWWERNNDPTDYYGEEVHPTHWMPLPTPPSRTQSGEDAA